jgi:hypothetical protein
MGMPDYQTLQMQNMYWEIESLKAELLREKEISKKAIEQLIIERGAKFKIGQQVKVAIMFDSYELQIEEIMTGPPTKYKFNTYMGSFWVSEEKIISL